MAYIINVLISDYQIPQHLIELILLLPIIATIVAFVRQIIGIKMFGAYAPIITTYAFLELGLPQGLVISLIIFLASIILKYLTRKLSIHYLPRMSILLTLVSLIVLSLLPLFKYFNLPLSPLPIIMLITLSDIYLTSQIQKGYKKAGTLYLETVIVSSIIFMLVSWTSFRSFLMAYPELIIIAVGIDIIIGKWTGLRITEFYRFKSVIKDRSKDYV